MPARRPCRHQRSQKHSQPGTGCVPALRSCVAQEADAFRRQSITITAGPGAFNHLIPATATPAQRAGAYRRDAFRHWTRTGDCTTREWVLLNEKVTGTLSGCDVIGGSWRSLYDGSTVTDPGRLDIDHVVPLKEAWVSGAYAWTPAKRAAFANDLDWAGSLIAVSAATNRSKSDKDPARWMPPDPAAACTYVATWVAVKWRWGLSMDAAERAKVKSVLAGCGDAELGDLEDLKTP